MVLCIGQKTAASERIPRNQQSQICSDYSQHSFSSEPAWKWSQYKDGEFILNKAHELDQIMMEIEGAVQFVPFVIAWNNYVRSAILKHESIHVSM